MRDIHRDLLVLIQKTRRDYGDAAADQMLRVAREILRVPADTTIKKHNRRDKNGKIGN